MLPRPGSASTEEIIDALAPPPEYVAPNPKSALSALSEADRLLQLPPEHAARRLSAPTGIACHGGAIFVVVAASGFEAAPHATARVLRLRECDGALLAASPLLAKVARPRAI